MSKSAIDPSDAAHAADEATGGMTPSSPSNVVEANVTIDNYGRELEDDRTLPSRLDLEVKGRPAWVVIFDDSKVPVLGPLDTGDGTTTGRTASTYTAQLAVVIDAATGAFLYARTL